MCCSGAITPILIPYSFYCYEFRGYEESVSAYFWELDITVYCSVWHGFYYIKGGYAPGVVYCVYCVDCIVSCGLHYSKVCSKGRCYISKFLKLICAHCGDWVAALYCNLYFPDKEWIECCVELSFYLRTGVVQ